MTVVSFPIVYAIPKRDDPMRLHPRKLAVAPDWDARLNAQWLDAQRIAHLFTSDPYRRFPTQSIAPRLVLALARRLATVEASNDGLRIIRGVE
jgi:hypothetical protein